MESVGEEQVSPVVLSNVMDSNDSEKDANTTAPASPTPSTQQVTQQADPPEETKPKLDEKKRYQCTFAGCSRDYSRAEHLYRHQLNHNPKEIFRCRFPGCVRTFVRQDLCNRHQERHFQRGKQESVPPDPYQTVTTSAQSYEHDEISALVARSMSTHGSNARSVPPPSSTHAQGDLYSFDDKHSPLSQKDREMNGGLGTTSLQTSSRPFPRSENHILPPPQLPSFSKTFPPDQMSPNRIQQSSMDGNYSTGFGSASQADRVPDQSPLSVRDEFTNWLFDDASGMPTAFSGGTFLNSTDGFGSQVFPNYFGDENLSNLYHSSSSQGQRSPTPMSTGSLAGHLLTEAKRKSLLSIILTKFNEDAIDEVVHLRESSIIGDHDGETHVLSMRSLQNYIGSYWFHFHEQMPILHQPTFSAEQTNPYLLLAMMILGASFLNKAHGRRVTESASEFAAFVAFHLRWEVFKDPDFRPPAKLWVFQTLFLLEMYEKLCASRALHERAHVHSTTTITLMRRGTALVDDRQSTTSGHSTTPEQWWSRWIQSEATKRVALAAFCMDAIDASMFGHNAVMVVHEIKLPLPCDDALWSATSAAEVGRVEASLHANGVQPPTFTEALRKILTGRKVRTNPFGRKILMAGLLSISWHMQQRDLQLAVLGISKGMGVLPSGWRDPLTKSFDFWKKDFEDSRAHMQRIDLPWQSKSSSSSDNDALLGATTLWHLAHMAMHADFRDCQILAGARSNSGRPITDTDRERARNNIHGWIRSATGRTAVYHALQILRDTLLSKMEGQEARYCARDDHLTDRPWILYVAGLTVWCWGFMTDGHLRPFPKHLLNSGARGSMNLPTPTRPSKMEWDTSEAVQVSNFQEAKLYLQTIGASGSPQELDGIKAGRNNVVGLLRSLELAFLDSRWELLHEAAERLRAAVKMLES